MLKSIIAGAGHSLPERVVTNDDLSKIMNTNNEWIVERTGIRERRWFTPGVDTVTSLAKNASIMAIQNAGIETNAIDFIIIATDTPD